MSNRTNCVLVRGLPSYSQYSLIIIILRSIEESKVALDSNGKLYTLDRVNFQIETLCED